MSALEELSRDELIRLVGEQAELLVDRDVRIAALGERVTAQDGQITAMATQMADLLAVNEALSVKLARLEHLLSRN